MGIGYSTQDVQADQGFVTVEPGTLDICRDVSSHRDWIFTADTGVLATRVSLRENMPRLYEHHIRGSSVSYAVAYILSYESVTLFRPSVEFIEEMTRNLGTVSCRMAMKSVKRFGVCEESEYEPSETEPCYPSISSLMHAANFKKISYLSVDFKTMRQAISMGYPVLMCLQQSDRAADDAERGVAVVVVAYDDASCTFEVLNCAGGELMFGVHHSYSVVPYSVVERDGHSMWIIKTAKYEEVLEI